MQLKIGLVVMLLLFTMASSTLINSDTNCTIASKTYNVDYRAPEMFFPIESTNIFSYTPSTTNNVTMNYSIQIPALQCSQTYKVTETFYGSGKKSKIAGLFCVTPAPILTSMNFTVIGTTGLNYTYMGYYNEGAATCSGYIFVNVTVPQPEPQPQPQPQPDSTTSEVRALIIASIINMSLLVLFALIALALYFCRKMKKDSTMLTSNEYYYARQKQ